MNQTRAVAEQSLTALVVSWLTEDPENWPVLRLSPINPWQERPGVWSEETPEWIRVLGAVAHETAGPFGQRPTPS